MGELPDGVVTFLFTDVEGSTRMWEEAPEPMAAALEQHDDAIDEAVLSHAGVSVKPRGEGDSRFVVFKDALDAVAAAVDMQRRLAAVDWATPRSLRVRASLHTGTADLRLGDYYGSAVNRVSCSMRPTWSHWPGYSPSREGCPLESCWRRRGPMCSRWPRSPLR